MPRLPSSSLAYCQQMLASSGTSKLLLHAPLLQRGLSGAYKVNHYSNDIKVPSNIVEQDETQKAKFSPLRSRDTSSAHLASRLDVAGAGRVFGRGLDSNSTTGAFNASNTPVDSHFTVYDQANSCSLSSVMQTNVPEPFNAHGDADYSSHLSMPGGQWAQNDKYLSADQHDHHYRNTTKNDNKKGESNVCHWELAGGSAAIASNKHPGSRQCSTNTSLHKSRTGGIRVTNMLLTASTDVGAHINTKYCNGHVQRNYSMISYARYNFPESLHTKYVPLNRTAWGLNSNKHNNGCTLLEVTGISDFSQSYSLSYSSSNTYPVNILYSEINPNIDRHPLLLSYPSSTCYGPCQPSSRSLTTSPLSQSEAPQEKKKSPPVLNSKQKLQRAVKDYGATVIVFHVTISLASLGICYLLVSSGVDMAGIIQSLGIDLTKDTTALSSVPDPSSTAELSSSTSHTKTSPSSDPQSSDLSTSGSVAAGVSTFVVAYAVHKVFAPARIALTLTATPLIVRRLRAKGFLKPPRPRR